MVQIAEKAFESAIEAILLAGGPDAVPGAPFDSDSPSGDYRYFGKPGGYRGRKPEEYDRKLCLIPGDVLDFVYATQPKEWEKLKAQHGPEVKEKFLARLSREISQRGVLDVLEKKYDAQFKIVFDAIRELMAPPDLHFRGDYTAYPN